MQGTPPMAENDSSALKAYQVVDCSLAAGVIRGGEQAFQHRMSDDRLNCL